MTDKDGRGTAYLLRRDGLPLGRAKHQSRVLTCGLTLLVLVAPGAAIATAKFSVNPGAPEQATSDETKRGSSPIRGDGIVLATGNKVEAEQDFAVDEEFGLYLRRTYNHHWNGVGLFGKHWLSNFDYSLAFSSGVAWVQRPDGRRIKFLSVGASRWNEDKAHSVAYLIRNVDGTYTLYNEERGTETYNADGYIVQRRSEQGLGWAFAYSGKYLQTVTHTSGRRAQFTWADGQITQVTDPAGNLYQYAYDPNVFGTRRGRLVSAVLPGSPATTVSYHYEDGRYLGALTGKSINGVRYSTVAYDDQRRAIRSERAGGVDRYSFSYVVESSQPLPLPPPPPPPGGFQQDQNGENESAGCIYVSGTGRICYQVAAVGISPMYAAASLAIATIASGTSTLASPTRLRVTETGPLGRQTTYIFQNGRLVSVESGTKVGARTYDANGYLDLVHDFEDGVTNFDYDAHGHLTKKTEGAGSAVERITTFVWDEAGNRLLQETLSGQRETTYAYKPDGRLESVSERNLSSRGSTGQTRRTLYSYTYKANGMLDTKVVDGPVDGAMDAVTYTYGTTNFLYSVTNGANHTTIFANYNDLGQPGRVTGPNGDVTEYAYDARGRMNLTRAIISGTPQATTISYNAAGQLASVQTPDGRKRQFIYDAALRQIEEYEREPEGTYARQLTTYNAASQATQLETVRSDHPRDTTIVGNVDGVASDGAGGYVVRGWACSSKGKSSIDVHMYLGGAAGVGIGAAAATANLTSEPAVAAACEVDNGAFRFSISITTAMREQHGGKAIYIHGISPAGLSNLLIASSGAYTIPELPPSSAPSVNAPAQSTSGAYTVAWTGVSRATRYRLEESANGGASWNLIYDAGGGSAAVSGRSAGTYLYRAQACNTAGCGPFSNMASVTEFDPPAAAPAISAPPVNQTGNYSVSWTAVAGATFYRLEERVGTEWETVDDTASLSYSFSGQSTSVNHRYAVSACNPAGCSPVSSTVLVERVIYNAGFVSQTVTNYMEVGTTQTVSVQMYNSGNVTWRPSEAYRLGSQNPSDNTIWLGTNRVGLTGDVAPGQTAIFTFNITAPVTAGARNFQWRMVRDGVEWFGAQSQNVVVSVAPPYEEPPPDECPPPATHCQPR